MSEQAHPNSKKVTILRKSSFAEGVQVNAAEFMSMSKKSIGTYYESRNAVFIGSGLNFAEKDLLMPKIIDIPKDDRTFAPEVKKFFESIVTKIPYDTGLELEIGMTLDNSKPPTYYTEEIVVEGGVEKKVRTHNWPISLMDFIRYRHAIGHPQVARTVAEARGNVLIQYYIFDPTASRDEESKFSESRDKALTIYMTVKTNMDKVDQFLLILGIDPRDHPAPDDRLSQLRKKADEKPLTFIEEYENGMFEQRYLLRGMMATGIIKKIGNQYVNNETNKSIGNNEKEALFYFTDPANADQSAILKGNLQEEMKKVVKGRKSRVPVSAKL